MLINYPTVKNLDISVQEFVFFSIPVQWLRFYTLEQLLDYTPLFEYIMKSVELVTMFKLVRDYSFSKCVQFFGKPAFLTPDTHTYFLRKILRTY